jgi:hypothetical protein
MTIFFAMVYAGGVTATFTGRKPTLTERLLWPGMLGATLFAWALNQEKPE